MRLGTFFLLILSISLLTNHIFSHDQTVIPSNIQQIIRELNHEEKVLWQELERLGIRKQQVSILQKTCLQEYITCRKKLAKKAANKPFSAQFMQLIERILTDFNINKKSISIIRYSDPEQIATATDFQLFIDEDELSKFP